MEKATVKPVATKEESGDVDHEEAVMERPIADQTASEKPFAFSKSENSGNPQAERTGWPHNLHVSPATVPHMETVFAIVRNINEREHDDSMDDLHVNMDIWGIFLNTTLQAGVHLCQDCEVTLRFVKNHLWKSLEQLFNETRRLIRDQTEIIGMKTIDVPELLWRSTSLLCSKAYQITNSKTYIFSDCVLCGRKMGDDPSAA